MGHKNNTNTHRKKSGWKEALSNKIRFHLWKLKKEKKNWNQQNSVNVDYVSVCTICFKAPTRSSQQNSNSKWMKEFSKLFLVFFSLSAIQNDDAISNPMDAIQNQWRNLYYFSRYNNVMSFLAQLVPHTVN